jgi:beta-N-acetylhexosaminidase
MGIRAGCDLVMVCRSLPLQTEALQGLELGLEGGTLEESKVQASVSRIIELKTRCTSWEAALGPAGAHALEILRKSHKDLSRTAYNRSITVVRDSNGQLPLTQAVARGRPILLLTPLITPLPSSKYHSPEDIAPEMRSSELVFQRFGAILGKHASTKVIHTSYSAHGVRSRHEDLISQAAAVVLITADANRNKYQSAFAKHVTLLCNQKSGSIGFKPCAVVAVTSPYDFASDSSIDPYICTYDYTETALRSLVLLLCGETQAKGKLPGGITQTKARTSRAQWLVEKFNYERDSTSLTNLLNAVRSDPETASLGLDHISTDGFLFQNDKIDNHQFVVRNSSTKELFGYCASYYFEDSATGYLGFLIVDPKRRKKSIGDSLHSRALQALQQIPGITAIQLGLPIPNTLPGVPSHGDNREEIHEWFGSRDWHLDSSIKQSRIMLSDLQGWKSPEGLSRSLNLNDVKYEILQGSQEQALVFEHVRLSSSPALEMLYTLASNGKIGSGVIRAKSLQDGEIIGTCDQQISDCFLA